MRQAGLFGALALLVVVNVVVLAGVARNRSGEPLATLRLTERELPVDYGFTFQEEDSGLALKFELAMDSQSPDWLDERKLRELGFRPERYAGTNGAYEKQVLPRRAWVALEFDGPAWQAVLAEQEKRIDELEARARQLERLRLIGSRLVAVDAGIDPAAMRARYADTDRYLITRARVRMWVTRGDVNDRDASDAMVHGAIEGILPATIHVPLEHSAALQAAIGDERHRSGRLDDGTFAVPRYAVVVNYGERYEPWVVGIEGLE